MRTWSGHFCFFVSNAKLLGRLLTSSTGASSSDGRVPHLSLSSTHGTYEFYNSSRTNAAGLFFHLSVSCPHNLPSMQPVYCSLPFPSLPQNVMLTHPTHDPLRRAQTTLIRVLVLHGDGEGRKD
ncbi:hypothetical protein EV421DRAFT_1466651 [Armillaria borealis]|uniref:Secreted protein n=1 Tax=Armillaria borealis TaxID=47425 RepID=A0AA39JTJ4_9AGAR|nr:hypothetical protein EV421DRAFT_1466651 [Armillaria borealis]